MISEEQIKNIDKTELNEALGKKIAVLELCIDAILSHYNGCTALYWAFEDAQLLIDELQLRLDKMPE